jgi:glycosyltransferase involved in cell wall biosynthesis
MSRIVIYIGSLDRGGTESHLMRTLPLVRAAGLPVELFVLSGRGVFIEPMRRSGVPVVLPLITRLLPNRRGGAWRLLLVAGLLPELLVRMIWRRPTIAHFFLPQSYCVVGPLAVLLGIRIRLMSRRSLNDYLDNKPSLVAQLEHWLHTRMTLVLGNAQGVIDELACEESVPADKLVLLRNGIGVSPLASNEERQATRRQMAISDASVALVIVANLIPYKGHLDLLSALAMLQADRDWTLLCIGADSVGFRENLEQAADSHGVRDRVRFLGEVDDVPRVLDASDVGILCSHEEGFSNALLEYMERELPVVATAVGGNSEAVVQGETGCLVPAHDPEALAQALDSLILDVNMRRRMGEAGRVHVVRHFDQAASTTAYIELYASLLLRNPIPNRLRAKASGAEQPNV